MALRRGWGETTGRRYPETGDKELIDALCNVEEGLRDREVEFIDDVAKQMARGLIRALTPDQRRWAEDIWSRVG